MTRPGKIPQPITRVVCCNCSDEDSDAVSALQLANNAGVNAAAIFRNDDSDFAKEVISEENILERAQAYLDWIREQ